MNLSEKAAYLKGLADGLGLKDDTSEQKILRGAVDLLAAISEKLEDLDGEVGNICGELDTIEDDLYETDDEGGDEEDDEPEEQEGKAQYELTCPKCGAVTVVDEDTLMSQEIVCSKCGAPFDIEFGENDEDEKK
ncbi:MAG: zinc-ribbon domain-containing protein [Faecalibacterium sp.]|jgi:uncharacterized protein YbaR (Trm112 family)|nr:zinc-ribbon domain-containing protein [Faecalibacterium sp.]